MVKLAKDNVLIIFMKAPRLREVKTRLRPELSARPSLNLHKAMGKDLVSHFSPSDDFRLLIYYWPENALSEMQTWLGRDFNYVAQKGSNLGDKLKNAFSESFTQDFRKVCIIGGDLPILEPRDVLEAFDKLQHHDVVVGPATDGGYYLIASKKYHPQLFQNIDWSTSLVLSQTLDRIQCLHLSVFQLPMMKDIDSYNDVLYLWKTISENDNKMKILIPNTIEVLKKTFQEK